MCALVNKTLAVFELGYHSAPEATNPFDIASDEWRHWNFGHQAAGEERAREEDERERENYFAWSTSDQD